ncbi:sulfotransferase family 2 domain-containing protein [Pseudodesulfovibrio sp.]|uniref:sulfotransferase family 2 domain-containing protein n=1 Tax=unclassified Pseudodesulfovibrio TaxID=2661612 RepID=UPI003AFFF2B2
MNRPFFFLHIPKTAGTTLNSVFDDNLSQERILDLYTESQHRALSDITYEEIARYRMVRGHVFITDFEEILDGPVHFRLFTFLRDPVQRVISEFYFLKRWPKSHLYEYLNRNNVSLMEYVTSENRVLKHRGRNNMVNSLSGIRGGNMEEGLELAWHHLRDRFEFFGILERFDESLLMLKRLMGLGSIFHEKKNVRGTSLDKPISREEYDLICEHNRFDLRLYERAVTEFAARVDRLGAAFQEDVRMFEAINSRFQRITNLVDQRAGLNQGLMINSK